MKVSVIIPCFNVADYIEECVASVMAQTHSSIEVICIDNNSSDNTLQKLEAIKEKYPQLILDAELEVGANAARNKGLSLASGQWIQFLDADDLLLEDKIAHQVALIRKDASTKHSIIAAAYTRRAVNGNEKTVLPSKQTKYITVFTNQAGITSGNLWNREALLAIDGWNEELRSSQEADLMMRLVLKGDSLLIDDVPKTIIRERESGQISQGNPSKKWKQYITVRIGYLERLKQEQPEVYQEHIGLFQDFLMVSILTLAKHDFAAANSFYNSYIKPNWKSQGLYGMSKLKVLLIKTFGLRIAS